MEALRGMTCLSHQENHCRWPRSCLGFALSPVCRVVRCSAVKLICTSTKHRRELLKGEVYCLEDLQWAPFLFKGQPFKNAPSTPKSDTEFWKLQNISVHANASSRVSLCQKPSL